MNADLVISSHYDWSTYYFSCHPGVHKIPYSHPLGANCVLFENIKTPAGLPDLMQSKLSYELSEGLLQSELRAAMIDQVHDDLFTIVEYLRLQMALKSFPMVTALNKLHFWLVFQSWKLLPEQWN